MSLIPWAVAALPIPSTHGLVDAPGCHRPGSVPRSAPRLQPREGQFPPEGGKAVLGNSLLEHFPHFPTPVSQPAGCPPRGSRDQAPAAVLWLITTCSLLPLPHLPLHPCPRSHRTQGLLGALPGFLGMRQPAPAFPDSGILGIFLEKVFLAVLRGRAKAGGSKRRPGGNAGARLGSGGKFMCLSPCFCTTEQNFLLFLLSS